MTKRIFKYDAGKFVARFYFGSEDGEWLEFNFAGNAPKLVDGAWSYKEIEARSAKDKLSKRLSVMCKTGFIVKDDLIYPFHALTKILIHSKEEVIKSCLVEELDNLPEGINFEDLEIADE